jgi:heterodisulfide reductase subunit A-like polyferredoxin
MFQVDPEECLCCGICVESCEHKAISLGEECAHIDQDLCQQCGQCHEVCPAEAIAKV